MAARRGTLALARGGAVHYLFHPPARKHSQNPVVILFGGTAQTINSLVGHHEPLAASGGLLQYELRGQGRTTTLPLQDCSLEQHVRDFDEVADGLFGEGGQVFGLPLFGQVFGLPVTAAHTNLVKN